MSKAFVKESDGDATDLPDDAPAIPTGVKNYITPAGHRRLQDELRRLVGEERPKTVEIVSWAAGNGDRSENGDYHLRQEEAARDRPPHPLSDKAAGERRNRRSGAADTARPGVFRRHRRPMPASDGAEKTVTIVGIDEVDPERGRVSWISPIARALLKAHEGDVVDLRTPSGIEPIEILEIRYEPASADA